MNFRKLLSNLGTGVLVSLITIPISYYYAVSRQHEYDRFVINAIVSALQDEIIACDPQTAQKLDVKRISTLIQGAKLKHGRSIDTHPEQLMNIVYHNIHTSPLITREVKTKYLAIVERTLDDAIAVDAGSATRTDLKRPSLLSLVAAITSVVALLGTLALWFVPKLAEHLRHKA